MTRSGLRFAMVTTFYPPYNFGGDGTYVQRLTHALARRGHSVDVIHDVDAYRTFASEPEGAKVDEPEGVRVHSLRSRLGPLSCLATQQSGRPVVHGAEIQQILSADFDVIHFHNISLVGGPGILSYGDAVKLYTAHEHWLVCPTHILWRHNREVCTGRECGRCLLHHRRPPQFWRSTSMLQRESQNVDAFIALSQFSADRHLEFGFEPPMNVMPTFLPDAEEDEADEFADSGPESDRPYYLFVGRLEKIKGLQDVVALFGEDSPVDLKIAGKGDFEPHLRSLIPENGRVQFLGHQTADQLRKLNRGAVALIVPSICYEVFPLVVLEAFREGTPILARNLGPFPEIVKQSEAGLTFDNVDELKAALSKLTQDVALRERLGVNAKVAFAQNWSETVALDRYFELIEQLTVAREQRSAPSTN